MQVEFAARLSEVVEGGCIRRQGLRFLREFCFLQEISHSGSDWTVSIIGLRQYGNAIIQRTQFSLFSLTAGGSILGILADRQANAPAFLAPLKVVGSFGMALRSSVYEDDVGTDSAV